MIDKYGSPILIAEDIHEMMRRNNRGAIERINKALLDIAHDLEAMQDMINVIDKWDSGEYSTQTLMAGYNIYCSERAKIKMQD
jgi:hypothetical protein